MPRGHSSLMIQPSSSHSDSTSTDGFQLFSNLPMELRLLIWQHTVSNVARNRVSVLCDPGPSAKTLKEKLSHSHRQGTKKLFQPIPAQKVDDRVALLHTNAESRAVALPVFTGAFGVPKPYYRFPSLVGQDNLKRYMSTIPSHAVDRILDAVQDFVNTTSLMVEYGKTPMVLGEPSPRLSPPLWFNVEEDFLLIPVSRDLRPYQRSVHAWNHCGTLQAGKVKKLAIEMSRADWDHQANWGHAVFPLSIWSKSLPSGIVEWEKLDKVEEIVVWTREGCEVCWFSKDTKNLLKPREWSVRLDTSNNQFTERFGERWSNITWRMVLGGSQVTKANGTQREKNMCELLRDWKPHASNFWLCKLQLTQKVPEGLLGSSWKELVSKSEHPSNPADMVLRKVEGAPDGTYFGPSYFAWG